MGMTTPVNKRAHLRASLLLAAQFDIGREAKVLDLSLGGARLEHEGALRPGDACMLRFALDDEVYVFAARVAWSRTVPRRDSREALRFQSGLAFERLPGAAKPLLAGLLAAPGEAGRSGPK